MMAFCRRLGLLWLFLLVDNLRFRILVNARSHPSRHVGGNRNGNGRFGSSLQAPSLAPTGDPPAPSKHFKHFKKSTKKRKTEFSVQEQPKVRGTKSGKKVKKYHKETSQRPQHDPPVIKEEIQIQEMQSMPKSHKRMKRSKKHANGGQQRQYSASKRELKSPPQSQTNIHISSDISGKRKHKQNKKGKKSRSKISDRHVDTSPQVSETKSSEKKSKGTKTKTKESSFSPVQDQTKTSFVSPKGHTSALAKRVEYEKGQEELHTPFESTDKHTSNMVVASSGENAASSEAATRLEVDGPDDQAIAPQDGHAMTKIDDDSIDDKQASTALDGPSVEMGSPSPASGVAIAAEADGVGADVDIAADVGADANLFDANASDVGTDGAAPDVDATDANPAAPDVDVGVDFDFDTGIDADSHVDPNHATILVSDDPGQMNHSFFVKGVNNALDIPQDRDAFISTIDNFKPDSDQDGREGGASNSSDDWEGQQGKEVNESLKGSAGQQRRRCGPSLNPSR